MGTGVKTLQRSGKGSRKLFNVAVGQGSRKTYSDVGHRSRKALQMSDVGKGEDNSWLGDKQSSMSNLNNTVANAA